MKIDETQVSKIVEAVMSAMNGESKCSCGGNCGDDCK